MAIAIPTYTNDFSPNINEIFEEAFERAGEELRTGYQFRTAARSMNYLLGEWANRGINLWTVEPGLIPLVKGQAEYFIPPNDNSTVDLLEHVVRTGNDTPNQTDITISRISMSTYASIPNKVTPGRPIQLFVRRLNDGPLVTVWPVPDRGTAEAPYYHLVYLRLRRIYDAGTGINTADVPFRFNEALVAGLAYKIALKLPNADPTRIQGLKAMYDEAWELASAEDREKAPVRFVPRISSI
jgi:hypothetical protein